MGSATRWWVWVGLGLLALLGCGEEQRAAPPPGRGSGGVPDSGGRADAGAAPMMPRDSGIPADGGPAQDSGMDVSDAGSAPLAIECSTFRPAMFVAEDPAIEPVASSTEPSDFHITRALIAWDSDCSDPGLRIELSDGRCPDGAGHTLVFWLDAAAIEDQTLVLGQNPIEPESEEGAIQVRYIRPARLSPSGEWGNCADASGFLNLRGEPPDTNAFTQWRGTFQLDLTRCEGADPSTQRIIGTFNLQTRRALQDVCPNR